jgi:hypothetical protein
MAQFEAQMDLTTEPNPDNYSYAVKQDGVTKTVVISVATIIGALNGVRDYIGSKIPGGHVVLSATLTVNTGPPPA